MYFQDQTETAVFWHTQKKTLCEWVPRICVNKRARDENCEKKKKKEKEKKLKLLTPEASGLDPEPLSYLIAWVNHFPIRFIFGNAFSAKKLDVY